MTDVIMTPGSGPNNQDGGGSNAILGVIVGVIIVLALLYFFVPGIRNRVNPPAEEPSPVEINVGGDQPAQ